MSKLDRVLPGVSRLVAGRTAGLVLVGVWVALLSLLVFRARRLRAVLDGGGIAEWTALITLLIVLGGCWWVGNRPGRPAAVDARAGHEQDEAETPSGRSLWSVAGRRFRGHRQAMLGLVLLLVLALLALLTPFVAPFDPNVVDLEAGRLLPPSPAHLMGTDDLGRDLFSRVLYGARISLSIGFLAVLIAITLGTLIGAVAGYAGGWADAVLMRIVDLFLSFPRIVLLITVVAVFEPSIQLIILVLGLTGWMGVSRLVRGQVLSVREREYVLAARALGFGPSRILFRHVLPNVLTPVIVAATLGIGNAVLAEAALSYLGLGVQPPTASWGNIIQAGGDRMLDAWWITAFPGLAIVFTVMSFNLVGDGLRDALDPRHSE